MSVWKKQTVEIKRRKGRNKGEVTGHRVMYTRFDKSPTGAVIPRLVGKTKIPANIFKLLQAQSEVDDTNLALEAPWRECIFCGEQGTKQRFVTLQTIYLCDEHYFNENIGRIVQRLREIKEGVPDAKEEKDVQETQDANEENAETHDDERILDHATN